MQIFRKKVNFLMSFPRSGSNFLQNVLQASSNLNCRSIYGGDDLNNSFLLKSHAFSQELLRDEMDRYGIADKIDKHIVLLRDPRDVMVSFFNFVKVRKNISLSQKDFLSLSYFYSAYKDEDYVLKRKTELFPLTIADAYKKFIENWYTNKQLKNMLFVKYEDLASYPEKEFSRIFNFFGLNCALDRMSINEKISLYSNEKRERGVPLSWKNNRKSYSEIIECTNKLLINEIKFLEY